MAATRLIALHINKGKTAAACLADRTNYSQNAEKTNGGEYVSSYACAPETVDEEFLLAKRQYEYITGRQQKNDVIAYQIRQSFLPGEITPEEANRVGYETAMRFLKGKHAFLVATHTDRAHIHNHIIFNSTTLDCTRKFRNFFLSAFALQRLSDMICLEHGLSVIFPKPYREREKRTAYPHKKTQREELCEAIEKALNQKPKTFSAFLKNMSELGYEYRDGKYPAFKSKEGQRFLRLQSLDEEHSEETIRAMVAGKPSPKRKDVSSEKQFHLLIDIQEKIAEGKSGGYVRWAKKYNRKEAARTVCLLKEKGIDSYEALVSLTKDLADRFDSLNYTIKAAEKRMAEISALQTHINHYSKTKKVYESYHRSGYSKEFFETHREELLLHKAAKAAFDDLKGERIPSRKELNQEFQQLLSEKKKAYAEYRKVKKEMQEYLVAKQTAETILGMDREKDKDKSGKREKDI